MAAHLHAVIPPGPLFYRASMRLLLNDGVGVPSEVAALVAPTVGDAIELLGRFYVVFAVKPLEKRGDECFLVLLQPGPRKPRKNIVARWTAEDVMQAKGG